MQEFEQLTNYELIKLFKRFLTEGLTELALSVEEEIFCRMEEAATITKPFQLLKGGIA